MKCFYKAALFIMGVFFMLIFPGCSDNIKYEKYISKNPAINFTIDCISGWEPLEQIGSFNSFLQICFFEPAIEGKGQRAMVVITIKESAKIDITPKTINSLEVDTIKKRMFFNSAKVLAKTSKKLFGTEARNIKLSYKTIEDPIQKIKLVPYMERIIIFERDNKFYIIRYANLAADFNKYSRAFDHIARSIKFL